MRTVLIIISLITCASAGAEWYGGASAGSIQLEGRCNAAFTKLGVTGCQHNNATTAWRGYVGYRFSPYFAVEGS